MTQVSSMLMALALVFALEWHTLTLHILSLLFVKIFTWNFDRAESKIIFVCPRPPDPQFNPRLKNIYCVLAGEKYYFIVCRQNVQ